MEVPIKSGRILFGPFVVELSSGELQRCGVRVKLHEQCFQMLCVLLQRPGEIVTRDELRRALWSSDTFVDFESGLNSAVKRLRDALGDTANSPRYVETIKRRGYRFIAPISAVETGSPQSSPISPAQTTPVILAPQGQGSRLAFPQTGSVFATFRGSRAARIAAGTLALIVAIPMSWFALRRHPGVTAASLRSIRSIAVLPLENLTGDSSQDYVVDGMTETLITNLADIDGVTVVPRTSVMRYKRTSKSPREIAKDLGADAVIEGSVARDGNHVRVIAEFIQGAPERRLWSKQYERDMTDIVALQDDVARAVAGDVRASLSPHEQLQTSDSTTASPAAYEACMRGRYFLDKRTKEGIEKAIDYFQQSIQIDPGYAPAYAGLADSYSVMALSSVSVMPAGKAWPKARAAALKALQLDESVAEAHASLALTKKNMDQDFVGAEEEYLRAIELNPNYAGAYLGYSLLLQDTGRDQEALNRAERAVELEPVSALMQANLGRVLVRMKRYDDAIPHLKMAIELDPYQFAAHSVLGSLYEQEGKLEEAITEQKKALALSPTSAQTMANLAHAYALAGNIDAAEQLLVKIKMKQTSPAYLIASVCVALGHKEEALMWLERSLDEKDTKLARLRDDWYFDSLRSDARFQGLVRQVDQQTSN